MRLRSVVLPEPEGPISATKSARGISSVSPCRTSIFCLPRSYTLVTSWTWTIGSDMSRSWLKMTDGQADSRARHAGVCSRLGTLRSSLGLAHRGAVLEVGRPIDDH